MQKKSWTVTIAATRDKIWKTLWDDATYRQWTAPFSESSHAETDWQEGSKVLFLDGKGSGMVSRIAAIRPNEFMSFEHLGMVKDGVEDTTSDAVKGWAGAHEHYTLTGPDGDVTVTVELDLDEQYAAMFDDMWPKAFAELKRLAEGA